MSAYEDSLAFLYGRLNYERQILPYGERTLNLTRMRELLSRLGHPEQKFAVVHIAGTKGKGSTAAMTAAVLQAAGYKTGLFTSPHLERVEERIVVAGEMVSEAEFAAAAARVQPAVAALDALSASQEEDQNSAGHDSWRPTYFEVVTALALVHFAEVGVHTAVLEVGLGGRLDSTNVCQPAVTAITSISFDHMQQLGNTLALIAREKAGIIKPGVPLINGVLDAEPRREIEQIAQQAEAPLKQLGRDFEYDYHPPHGASAVRGGAHADLRVNTPAGWREWPAVQLGLVGRHQAANAAVAVAALMELVQQGWNISDEALRRGLAQVRWPARIELLATRPTVILDSAHNRASIEALLETLDESFPARRRVAVFAASRDKDLAGMLSALLPRFDHVVLTRFEVNPRAAGADELAAVAATCGSYPVTVCPLLADVPAVVAGLVGPDDLICITGSIFIAAELRPLFAGWQVSLTRPLTV